VSQSQNLKILIADKIAPEGLEMLKAAASQGVSYDVKAGLTAEQLAETAGQYDAMVIRSKPDKAAVSAALAKPGKLRAIARAGVGVDNVDLAAATTAGILVMNTPDANTVSAAEHTIALMMALSRNVFHACSAMKSGRWDREKFVGQELQGKTLGVIGLGRIGRAVAERAYGLKMNVLGFDKFFSGSPPAYVKKIVSFEELLAGSDFITIHVPGGGDTKHLIGKAELAKTKKGVCILNVARGGVIDEAALAEAIKSGHVAGAGVDVFVKEPPEDRTLVDLPQVLCTPHLGASTVEAQTAVSTEAVSAVLGYLVKGEVRGAVNLPGGGFDLPAELRPYFDLAGRMGKLLSPLCANGVKAVAVTYKGGLAGRPTGALTGNFASSLLQPYFSNTLNLVNIAATLKQRGIALTERDDSADDVIATAMEASVTAGDGTVHSIAGAVFRDGTGRILAIDGYPMEMKPRGRMVLLFNRDQPGVIGTVGTIFGKHRVNIAEMTISRLGERALMVLNIDNPGPEALAELSSQPPILMIKEVVLP
jgi:D-3-phosphoglycerate dehydrogenase